MNRRRTWGRLAHPSYPPPNPPPNNPPSPPPLLITLFSLRQKAGKLVARRGGLIGPPPPARPICTLSSAQKKRGREEYVTTTRNSTRSSTKNNSHSGPRGEAEEFFVGFCSARWVRFCTDSQIKGHARVDWSAFGGEIQRLQSRPPTAEGPSRPMCK